MRPSNVRSLEMSFGPGCAFFPDRTGPHICDVTQGELDVA